MGFWSAVLLMMMQTINPVPNKKDLLDQSYANNRRLQIPIENQIVKKTIACTILQR